MGVPLVCDTHLADAVNAPKRALFHLAAALIVGCWAGRARPPRLAWLAAAPLFWCCGATLLAGWPADGQAEALAMLELALVGLAWSVSLNAQRQARWLNWVLLTATVSVAYSWLQRLGLDPLGWSNPHLSRFRTIATFGNPDFLALYLVVAAPLLLDRVLSWQGTRRWLGAVGWLLLALALVLSITRGSWVAGLAAALVWLWEQRRDRGRLGASLLLLALTLPLGALAGRLQPSDEPEFTVARRVGSLLNPQENSAATRLWMWGVAGRLALRHPLHGFGLGSFSYETLRDREGQPMFLRPFQKLPGDPHSQYFSLLAWGGFPALLLALAALAQFFRQTRDPARRAAMTALAVNLLFLTCTLETAVLGMFLVACSASRGDSQLPARPWLPLALAALALYAGGVALWAESQTWWGDEYLARGQAVLPDRQAALTQFAQAQRCYVEAVQWAPRSAQRAIWERLGLLQLQAYRDVAATPEIAEEAVQSYARAALLTPGDPYPWAGRARLFELWSRTEPRRFAESEQAWREALARDPRNPQFWSELGVLYATHARPQDGLRCLDQALSIFPGSADFWRQKAQMLTDLGRSEEARQALEEAARVEPPKESLPSWPKSRT